jgi:phosphocarrier protein FPr
LVGIVVVSHSEALAQGVVRLAREMAPPDLIMEPAGGIGEPGVLGTSADLVRAAIERAMSPDGVLVLMDLGSALMSAEFAVELLEEAPGEVRLTSAPLVEGTVAAAAAAGGGASLDEVAVEAQRALAMKSAQIGEPDADAGAAPAGAAPAPKAAAPAAAPDAEAELLVANEVGLHARPAARFVETAGAFDAEVLVTKAGTDHYPVSARSLTNVVALAARKGDRVLVRANGPQAREAVAALQELAASGFGDGLQAPAAGTVLRGVAASAGVAVGPARLLAGIGNASASPAPVRAAGSPEDELRLLERAIESARESLVHDRERLRAGAGAAQAEIFDAHLALLEDPALLEPARAAIAAGVPAERAIESAGEQVAGIYRDLDDPLLAERAADVLDVGQRIMATIAAAGSTQADEVEGVVVADELLPSQSARLDPERVTGIATARGSSTAHAAIIARALGIPAVVGLGDEILTVPDGTMLLLDGDAGSVTVTPSDDRVSETEARRERSRLQAATALEHANEQATLASGERIEVYANIGGVDDAVRAVELGAEGVGLLRTEFLFLDRPELPDEAEQAAILRAIATTLRGRPLIVRTLDAGADKPLPAVPMPPEANPFLGVRGIRVGLLNRELLATQLRAIVRVADAHPVRVMLPMVATLGEIESTRALLEQARADTGVAAPLELGIMVEVPAAALMAAQLAPHVDFFSLGTNDLTQYTMAAERGDARLAPLLASPQPAVLRLVQATVQAAAAHDRWVGVCGEMAGDPATAILLAGLGVTELSMAPTLIPEVKAALRRVRLDAARSAAIAALDARDAEAARRLGADLLWRGDCSDADLP